MHAMKELQIFSTDFCRSLNEVVGLLALSLSCTGGVGWLWTAIHVSIRPLVGPADARSTLICLFPSLHDEIMMGIRDHFWDLFFK